MNARHIALVEQKEYLNEQLKAIMKRNRVLQAEIDYALQEAPHLRQQHSVTGTHNQCEESPSVRYRGGNNNDNTMIGSIQEGQFLFDEESSGEYGTQQQQQQQEEDRQQDHNDQSGSHNRRYREYHGSRSNYNASGIPLSLSVSCGDIPWLQQSYMTSCALPLTALLCTHQIPTAQTRQQTMNRRNQCTKGTAEHTRSTPLLHSNLSNNPLSKGKNPSHHSAKQLLRNSSVPEGIGYCKSVSTADKHAINAFRNPLSPGKDAATRSRELALLKHNKTHKQKLEEFLAEQ